MEMRSYDVDLKLHDAFGRILSNETFSSEYVADIVELIYNKKLSRENLQKILDEYNIKSIDEINEELLDLLIVYIKLILNDQKISENEIKNIGWLKIYFKIKEGDFYEKKYDDLKQILHRQFEWLYFDNTIDDKEAEHNVELQNLFDLSYDQFDEFKEDEVQKAINEGADILDLDTAKYPKVFKTFYEAEARSISQQVKDLVWNRDGGKCVECGSKEKLEFDHIIPFSKSGSNTYRNIQLLCEPCNRTKSDKLG